MKVSYKVLKKYIPDIKSPEAVAEDLVMHTAEVEGIHSEASTFEHVVYGIIKTVEAHPNADSLRVCMVDIGEEELSQIVCGGSNLAVGQAVAVAKVGASVLWHGQGEPVVMKKTAIRGIESSGMICAAEEIGLKDEFPSTDEKEILDLSHIPAKVGTPLAEVLGKDDVILEIDNKAINHRPDLFSHIGVAREVATISSLDFNFSYEKKDFSNLSDAGVVNHIPEQVQRYMACYVSGVKNTPSPQHILDILGSHEIASKGILVDISNYSLYLYGQPTHCFDRDKVVGNIHIRFAHPDESFTALNDKTYTLTENDIVIADNNGILALGGIIGGKSSAVSETTENIIIESAHFDQATIRKTGKRLGIRTDALNVFEKNISLHMQEYGMSIILSELQKIFKNLTIDAYSDVYQHLPTGVTIAFSHERITGLIGVQYDENTILEILSRLGIYLKDNSLHIPFWRTDLDSIADIAEEVARIYGYNEVPTTIPRITLGAISQSIIYTARRQIRNFLVAKGFYEMYTYSFVNQVLIEKSLEPMDGLIPLKNTLSEEMTHMRRSLIPNLLASLESNARDFKNLKLFECEKVFSREEEKVQEHYELSLLVQSETSTNMYYDMQFQLQDLFSLLQISKYSVEESKDKPGYAHPGRIATIKVQGREIGYIGEIHPAVLRNFGLTGRVGCISIHMDLLQGACYKLPVARELSLFQENNFDINFVVAKEFAGKNIQDSIQKSHPLIQKVELFDIYESDEKLPGKRSLSFTVYIQSMKETLDDTVKNQVIDEIIKKVEKIGGKLR